MGDAIDRRPASNLVKIQERTGDPVAEAGRAIVYVKDVSGTNQLFARTEDGTVNQLTPVASQGVAPFPEKWSQLVVPANQAATAMGQLLSQLFDDTQAIRPFSVVGIGLRADGNCTAGTATAKITKNGVAGTLSAVLTAGNAKVQATQASGTDTFIAGDTLGVTLETSAGFLPTASLNMEVWLEIDYINT